MSTPDEPSFNVSVFHFTSRISSAKIRKYKSATEKGMGPATGNGRTPTPGLSNRQPTPSATLDPKQLEEPPAKKARLKLKVRESGHTAQNLSPDTIAVARPRRGSSLRVQYSEVMDVDDVEATDAASVRKPRAPSAVSTASSLTSLSSAHSGEKGPVPVVAEGGKKSANPGDYNRDFLSYYVTGDADDEDEGEDDAPVPASVKPVPVSKPQIQPTTVQPTAPARAPVAAAQAPRPQQPHVHREMFRNHTGPPLPYPTSAREKPTVKAVPQPPAQPCVHLIDNNRLQNGSRPPVPVGAMVAKLQSLSHALASFGGGLPSRPSSPVLQKVAQTPVPASARQVSSTSSNPRPPDVTSTRTNNNEPQNKSAADGLLAMFDDDDDSSDDTKTEASGPRPEPLQAEPAATVSAPTEVPLQQPVHLLDYPLEQPGDPDAALYYGIKFIQNALRSWARQRLNTEYAHFYWTEHQKHRNQLQPQRRGPGRPRKFEDERAQGNLPPANISMNLAHTNEGRTIAAFQDVLESGCLQVNASLPIELSRALRTLYAQINQLINQIPEYNMPWHCLSYDVQITANKIRVDEWKEARNRAQVEMERQQQIAQQQVMQQMGIRSRRPVMFGEQIRQSHAADRERRHSSLQGSQQQPPHSQYASNVMPMGDHTAAGNATHIAAPRRVSNGPAATSPCTGPPIVNGLPSTSHLPNLPLVPSSPASMQDVQLDTIKQLPNLFSRSGQSMKFSFAPNSELALKTFGPQAFPANQAGSNLPNRGPMGAGPASPSIPTSSSSPHQPNGVGPTMNHASHQSPPAQHVVTAHPSDTIKVASRPSSRQTSQSSPTTVKQRASLINGNATVHLTQSTERNASSSSHPAHPISASKPVPTSSYQPSSGDLPNGKAVADNELTTRFPHPGAVVVNE